MKTTGADQAEEDLRWCEIDEMEGSMWREQADGAEGAMVRWGVAYVGGSSGIANDK